MAKHHKKGGGARLNTAALLRAKLAVETHGSITAAAAAEGVSRQTLAYRYNTALRVGVTEDDGSPKEHTKTTSTANGLTIDYMGVKIDTPEMLLEDAAIDLKHWEIERVVINNWEVGGKIKSGQARHEDSDDGTTKITYQQLPEKLWKTPLRQIKISLRRKSDERLVMEELLLEMKAHSTKAKKIKYPALFKSSRRCLELCIMDPHFGMNCFPPGADHAWSMEDCHSVAMWAIESLLKGAEPYASIEQIVFPFGNDFLHADNVFHTTTAGTPQPEMMPWQLVYKRGIDLAIAMVERMKEVAPVQVYSVPGNHDRQSAYTLGHVLWAYFHNDPNVTVDATEDSYKFHRYGTNLIGYEHGHSIPPIRMAALMANECSGPGPRQGWWDQTSYREWHIGDQHRKGSSKPNTFEEQGVSIEYLPGLTPPNEWHRIKSYNWQKRGAMGFVWDHDKGPIARIQVNMNSYTGAPTGMSRKDTRELFRS